VETCEGTGGSTGDLQESSWRDGSQPALSDAAGVRVAGGPYTFPLDSATPPGAIR
jgi:hypothetical protein